MGRLSSLNSPVLSGNILETYGKIMKSFFNFNKLEGKIYWRSIVTGASKPRRESCDLTHGNGKEMLHSGSIITF